MVSYVTFLSIINCTKYIIAVAEIFDQETFIDSMKMLFEAMRTGEYFAYTKSP